MSASDKLVKQLNDAFEHETVSSEARVLLDTLVKAYIDQVAACLRLESAIHRLTKD